MTEFNGFPDRMRFTPVPNLVFSALFPLITDILELKLLFHVFEVLYPKKGSVRCTSLDELLQQPNVIASLKTGSREKLGQLLEALAQKGVLLRLQDFYFINNESNRATIAKIRSGELALPGLITASVSPLPPPQPSDAFTLYEQNIGMLTPLIADELREAEKQYPESWIKDAIKEAVTANKRNWRYIARILEHWSAEGKDDGTYRGNPKKDADPDKFIRGKYGHMVQR
jgi:DnaD/phage-associated family protein